jgi:hypothetical protein
MDPHDKSQSKVKIKLLQQLKNEEAVTLKSTQQTAPDRNLLQTVLDQGPDQENTKKTRSTTNRHLELKSESNPHLKTKVDPKQITPIEDLPHDNLASRPAISEGSIPGKVYC